MDATTSYPTLAIALTASLVAESLFGRSAAGWVVPLLSLGVLLGVVLVASGHRGTFRIALILVAIPVFGLAFRWVKPESDLAVTIAFASLTGFYVMAAFTILAHVLRTGRVSFQKVIGAVCVYLLLGMAWAWAYSWMHWLDPGALSFPVGDFEDGRSWSLAAYQYFSFITLTTLGYGDIVPRSDDARTLAMAEAVVGQLFVAVLLARLVSLEVTHSARSEDD